MERATELHWLKFFYQHADMGLTEEQRIEIERQFVKEENLLLPKQYEIDDDPIPMNNKVEAPYGDAKDYVYL